MPVVISNISNQYEIFSGFRKYTKSGPLEFINLLNNAKFVCTSSFHGTVFSILLHKPFIAIDGESDKRISTLLSICELNNCAIKSTEVISKNKVDELLNTDFSTADANIEIQRQKALAFLSESLE